MNLEQTAEALAIELTAEIATILLDEYPHFPKRNRVHNTIKDVIIKRLSPTASPLNETGTDVPCKNKPKKET